MQTQGEKKVEDTMMETKWLTQEELEQVDANLIAIQNEYLENVLGVN